jgi:hypothetical protein
MTSGPNFTVITLIYNGLTYEQALDRLIHYAYTSCLTVANPITCYFPGSYVACYQLSS